MWSDLRHRIRALFRRERLEKELDGELQFHIEHQTEKYLGLGLTAEEASRRARLEFGGIVDVKEQYRDSLGICFLDRAAQDLRFAVRMMQRSPGVTGLAVLIMALGIGANTAVFSVVNAVLLRPLPYIDPDRIVTLASITHDAPSALAQQVSIPDFQDWHDQSSSFEAMAYYSSRETAVMIASTAEYARVAVVSPDFFRVFKIGSVAGRILADEDVKAGGGSAALISYRYWQSHFAGDPHALGQSLSIVSASWPIVGVLPPGFQFPQDADVWVPAVGPPGERSSQNNLVVARLKPGTSLEQAQNQMTLIAARLEEQYPDTNKGRSAGVTRMRDEIVGSVRATLYMLLGGVTLVLLIACTNTAILLLGKATSRRREVALRTALGASRRRIVSQLITENILLAFIAGSLGLLVAYIGSKSLIALAPSNLPRVAESETDRWVLGFTLGLSIITSFVFGLVPALSASRIDLNESLKQGGARAVRGGGPFGMRGLLAIAEISLAVVLLCSAGLLIKSFVALQDVALGFRPENVLVMRATVPVRPSVGIARARQFFSDALAKIATLPGVVSSGATMAPPGNVDSTGIYLADRLPPRAEWASAPRVVLSIVAPGTFQALGVPLKSGRDFSANDTTDKQFVAVVNEALVRKSFPDQSPLGRTIYCPFDTLSPMTIIGVVGDVRQRGPERESMPECYMPYLQHGFNGATLSIVVRTAGDPDSLTSPLRRIANDLSPDVPMKFTTMEALVSANVATARFRTLLLVIFAVLATCLAMGGVYGVISYAVSQRSNEIGIRMALGADAGSVLRFIIRQGLMLSALGLVIGLIGAVASTRAVTSMLFQVRPNDPSIYLGVIFVTGMAALLATYVPAKRASKIDPLVAIREE